jgi:hypothetical protein
MAADQVRFDISEFKDGDTVHMIIRDDGSLYVVPADVAGLIARDSNGGSARVKWVDRETNTIWLEPAQDA